MNYTIEELRKVDQELIDAAHEYYTTLSTGGGLRDTESLVCPTYFCNPGVGTASSTVWTKPLLI